MLDAPTLTLAVVLDDLVLLAALGLAIPRRAALGVTAWCASLGLQALAGALLGLSAATSTASIVVVDAALALSLTLQLASLSAFYRRRFARRWHLGAALGCGLIGGALNAQAALRLAVISLIYAGALGALGLAARRWHGAEPGRGNRLLGYAAIAGGAGAALAGLRLLAAARWPVGVLQLGPLPFLIGFGAQATTIATSLGFLLLHRERQELDHERQAMIDTLTGVYNRRTLFDLGDKELQRARRTGASLSIVLLGVDHFKRINDQHGHLGGDAVLVRFVEIVRGCLRASDLLTRYGGEEFCVLLPGVGRAGARVVGERLRAAVEASSFVSGNAPLRVTASVGVADLPTREETTLSALVARADQALYVAKRDGRNRVSVAPAA